MNKIIETDRLILRTWTDNDLQPMLAINQDPKLQITHFYQDTFPFLL